MRWRPAHRPTPPQDARAPNAGADWAPRPAAAWQPVGHWSALAWLLAYAAYLVHAAVDRDGILLFHPVDLVFHEAGHLLFGWLGHTAGLWGGTLGQLLAPAAVAGVFAARREAPGVAFGAFWFFENWLDIAVYVADARRQALPLVTAGEPSAIAHDWFRILSALNALPYDRHIAAILRTLGWLGMIASVAWLARRAAAGDGTPVAGARADA
jgi:hypothetical protein